MKVIQRQQLSDKVSISIRKCRTKHSKITASDTLDQTKLDSLLKQDHAFYLFQNIRNSPPYLQKKGHICNDSTIRYSKMVHVSFIC